jgi:hypothetical protein
MAVLVAQLWHLYRACTFPPQLSTKGLNAADNCCMDDPSRRSCIPGCVNVMLVMFQVTQLTSRLKLSVFAVLSILCCACNDGCFHRDADSPQQQKARSLIDAMMGNETKHLSNTCNAMRHAMLS